MPAAPDATAKLRTLQFQLQTSDVSLPDLTGYADPQRRGVDVTLTPLGGRAQRLIVLAHTVYLPLSAKQRAELRGRARWGKIDLDRVPRTGQLARQLQLDDPGWVVSLLRGVSQSHLRGTARVAGISTRRYRARGDARRAVARLSADERARFGTALRRLMEGGGGTTAFAGDVWLDREGRVVRERLTSGSDTITLSLFGFNATRAGGRHRHARRRTSPARWRPAAREPPDARRRRRRNLRPPRVSRSP